MLRGCTLPKTAPAAFGVQSKQRRATVCQAQPTKTKAKEEDPAAVGGLGKLQVGALGDLLGPIGITIGKDVELKQVSPLPRPCMHEAALVSCALAGPATRCSHCSCA